MKYVLNLSWDKYLEIITTLKDNPTFQKYGIAGMAVSAEANQSVESMLEAGREPFECVIHITDFPKCRRCGSEEAPYFSRIMPMGYFCGKCGSPWTESDGVG